MNQIPLPLPSLSAISAKKIEPKFDGGRLSSDGGVVLLVKPIVALGCVSAWHHAWSMSATKR